jgi:hypothetical protein
MDGSCFLINNLPPYSQSTGWSNKGIGQGRGAGQATIPPSLFFSSCFCHL